MPVKREKERKATSINSAQDVESNLRNERYDEVFDIVRQRLLENHQKQAQEEDEMKQAQAKQDLWEESSVRGFLERNRTYTEPVVKVLEAVDSLTTTYDE